ncbi:MAG: hypothetical protein GXP15_08275 [Gammaproteobacteria bacterium]|nr:hypothetical protein [Gammaproteobacteria bacterium]
MSRIQIECDRCGTRINLPVRQNYEARQILVEKGWTQRDTSSRYGRKKEDYCPECRD